MLSFLLAAIREYRQERAKGRAAMACIDRAGRGPYMARHRAWKKSRTRYRHAGGTRGKEERPWKKIGW